MNRKQFAKAFLAVLGAIALVLAARTRDLEARNRSPLPLAPPLPFDPALAGRPAPGEVPLDLDSVDLPEPFDLRRGQTLGGLLGEMGLSPFEVHRAAVALGEHVDVRRLKAGESGVAWFDRQDRLRRLRLGITGRGWVSLARVDGGWRSDFHEYAREVTIKRVEGHLEDVLIKAIAEAGADPALAYRMSDVLQWDLDFHRDLRRGDRFAVVFESVLLDDDPAGPGDILALVYENRGVRYEAYRFGDDAYYDAEGRPMQKMFLRSPMAFSRVTSRFSRRRYHPVLKVHRPHYGVDYGAPTGTPARVTASGVVTFAGRQGQAGNMVKVRHPKGFETAYLHLSRFGPGVRSGKRVHQGDVIGYVGSTGLATAPHLDYRVRLHDEWIDPLSLRSVPADPITEEDLPAFRSRRELLRVALAGDLSALAPGPSVPRPGARTDARRLSPIAQAPSMTAR